MKTNIATNKEQSARLLRCGVSADTADMSWRTILCPSNDEPWADPQLSPLPYSEAKDIYGDDYIEPAWSLSALCEVLPREIKVDPSPYDEIQRYGLLIYPYMGGWQVEYQYCEDDECYCLKCVYGTDPIEACVQLIEWLMENNYKLNEQ